MAHLVKPVRLPFTTSGYSFCKSFLSFQIDTKTAFDTGNGFDFVALGLVVTILWFCSLRWIFFNGNGNPNRSLQYSIFSLPYTKTLVPEAAICKVSLLSSTPSNFTGLPDLEKIDPYDNLFIDYSSQRDG